jgi:hypothetical protein
MKSKGKDADKGAKVDSKETAKTGKVGAQMPAKEPKKTQKSMRR